MNVLCLGSEIVGAGGRAGARRGVPGGALRRRRALRRAAREGGSDGEGDDDMAESRLAALAARGQSVWIDLLSRELVRSGELQRLVDEDSVTGLTSNPTIFQKAIASGDYDERHRRVPRARPTTRARSSSSWRSSDVRDACDVFAPGLRRERRRATGSSRSRSTPGLAHDTDGDASSRPSTCTRRVDRPNLYVKIPATPRGAAGDRGLHRPRDPDQRDPDLLARALPRGGRRLPARARAARSPAAATSRAVSSVASFFVSRLDTEADARLDELGRQRPARASSAIANARLAYAALPARRSPARTGSGCAAAGARRSVRSGRRPRPRTPPTATSCTSRS